MNLTWELVGVLTALVTGVSSINLLITRALIRQELDKFQLRIRPIGECLLIHAVVNTRLDKLERVTGD